MRRHRGDGGTGEETQGVWGGQMRRHGGRGQARRHRGDGGTGEKTQGETGGGQMRRYGGRGDR